LLDLGCGSGVVSASLQDNEDLELFASDISQEAIDFVEASTFGIKYRCGSLFEPWQFCKFDYICDDVSGVAKEFAFPWFEGVATAGEDGSDLVCQVIQQAPKYLEPLGKLFFPIVSLSNQQKIKSTALNTFENLKLIGHQDFILHEKLQNIKLPKEYYKISHGIKMMWTDIYMCTLDK
jgi:methylase of polypeptide subunit release factors